MREGLARTRRRDGDLERTFQDGAIARLDDEALRTSDQPPPSPGHTQRLLFLPLLAHKNHLTPPPSRAQDGHHSPSQQRHLSRVPALLPLPLELDRPLEFGLPNLGSELSSWGAQDEWPVPDFEETIGVDDGE